MIYFNGPISPWGDVYLPDALKSGPQLELTKKLIERGRRLKEYEKQLERSENRQSQPSAFLSYSHHDRKWAHGLSLYLEMVESDLYIDLRDDSLPREVGRKTARTLRRRISDRDKFILLATDRTSDSAWVPWELGLADGLKGHDNVVIFPLSSVTSFEGQEYFDDYSRVETSGMGLLVVVDPQHGSRQEFSHWLHGVHWSKFRDR